MNTLKENISDFICAYQAFNRYDNSVEIERIADQHAIGFAIWLEDECAVFSDHKVWRKGDNLTMNEALEIYKKEQELTD